MSYRNRCNDDNYGEERGMDDSLLFFFLILVFLFCNPSKFGCGRSTYSRNDGECCENRRSYDCDDDCDC